MKYEIIDNQEYSVHSFTMTQQSEQDKKVETLIRKYVDADDKCNRLGKWMPHQRKACNEASFDALMETYKYAKDVFKDVQIISATNKK